MAHIFNSPNERTNEVHKMEKIIAIIVAIGSYLGELLVAIDGFWSGMKTYLASGVGIMVVAYLQSKNVDVGAYVGIIDTFLNDATTQVNTVVLSIVAMLRGSKQIQERSG